MWVAMGRSVGATSAMNLILKVANVRHSQRAGCLQWRIPPWRGRQEACASAIQMVSAQDDGIHPGGLAQAPGGSLSAGIAARSDGEVDAADRSDASQRSEQRIAQTQHRQSIGAGQK